MNEWEPICEGAKRLRVYDGWFVVTTVGNAVGIFVSDPMDEWLLKVDDPDAIFCQICLKVHSGGC